MTSATATFRERSRLDHDCDNCRGRNERLAMQLERTRDRFRVTGGATAQQATVQQPGEVLSVVDVDFPAQQPPSSRVPVDVVLDNSALFVGGDPNRCIGGELLGEFVGLEVTVTLEAGGAFQDSDTVCVAAGPAAAFATADLSVTTPAEDGPFTFTIRAETASTGEEFFAEQRTIDVQTGAQPAPEERDDEEDGGLFGGPILPCFVDPNRACARPEALAWGGLGLLAAIVLVGR